MELDRRGQEVVHDLSVQLDGCIYQLSAHLGDVRVEPAHVAVNDLEVDASDNLRVGHLHCKGHEVTLHAWGDVEGAGGGVHASHKLAVDDLLQENLHLVVPVG